MTAQEQQPGISARGTLQFVAVERAGHVATVTIQRPDKLNALNAARPRRAHRAPSTTCSRPPRATRSARAILTGAGKAFVAGADIAEMARHDDASRRSASPTPATRLGALIETLPFPVIAAVNGFALGGGCELALACDFIYAADSAKLGQPEVNLGVIPGFGGTQRLLRRVGVARARASSSTRAT